MTVFQRHFGRGSGKLDAHSEGAMRRMILEATAKALREVTHPRFFRSERGYQGRFYCALQGELDRRCCFLEDGFILEMEYQKGERQKMRQRPDIILHSPAEESGASVRDNNLAAFYLKLRATPNRALEDFGKIDEIFKGLQYPLSIFINIGSQLHHLDQYRGHFRDLIHAFAVCREVEGTIIITHAWWEGNALRERQEW
jgi:hypothetical protein